MGSKIQKINYFLFTWIHLQVERPQFSEETETSVWESLDGSYA